VRLALGAQKANIYRLVLRDGLMPVLMGAGGGIAIAFGFARVIASLLFQVSPYNPAIAGIAVCILVTVGGAACFLPARRAAGVDPIKALHAE
jgi:ABC-type antimicrobial peptide transport system permease subunit